MLTAKPRLPLKHILLFGLLPSPLKILLYRLRGYRIEAGVSLALGSVLIGDNVTVGRGTKIGFLTIVRGGTIRLGNHVQIGAMTFLDTPHVEIGDGTKINEQVFIGGLQQPDSRFIVGRNCQIMQMTFINPTRSIRIGDDTGIGGDCLLFGHTSWLSVFEGYPVDFEPIEIGNSVSIAWRVFVLPGAKIGDGAVIGANSLVRGNIPGKCLAVGFPARVVSKAPEFPREVDDAEKERLLQDIITNMIEFLRGSGVTCEQRDSVWAFTHATRHFWGRRTRTWNLSVFFDPLRAASIPDVTSVVLSLRKIPDDVRRRCEERGVIWIDIEQKERSDRGNELGEEIVQFLRRYGVRFNRIQAPGARADATAAATN